MANTTEDKLRLLNQSKIAIKNAIIASGVTVSANAPLSAYADLIKTIREIVDTTPLEDMLVMADLQEGLYTGTYTEHDYSEEEQFEINELLNLIVGEE